MNISGVELRVLHNDDVNAVRLIGDNVVFKATKPPSGSWTLQGVKAVPAGVQIITPGWQTSIEAVDGALPDGLTAADLVYIVDEGIRALEHTAADLGVRL